MDVLYDVSPNEMLDFVRDINIQGTVGIYLSNREYRQDFNKYFGNVNSEL